MNNSNPTGPREDAGQRGVRMTQEMNQSLPPGIEGGKGLAIADAASPAPFFCSLRTLLATERALRSVRAVAAEWDNFYELLSTDSNS